MTAQDLKNSILQLAMQGKLVVQRAEEGTAKELIEQIGIEKERLIKEGKIRKEKPLPKITEEEIPFEIPKSWEWVRWGNLANSIQYGYNAPSAPQGNIHIVRISDIQNNIVNWNTVPYCQISEKEIPMYLLSENDLLFARTGGTVGKSYLVTNLTERAIFAGYLIRSNYNKRLCSKYLKYFMESPLYWSQLQSGITQTAQPNCNGKTLSKMTIPIPPIEEQKRIVEKIDELLPYIERYEKAYSKLEILDKNFSGNMQKSILQYAMQGKLVEQRPEEGTGEELYQKIRAEKKQLIKAGKIKNEKCLSEISESEIPYEIPQGWCWVRLGELGTYKKGPFGSALTKSLFVPKGSNSVKVYEQKNAIKKDEKIGEYYITKDYFESKMRGFEVLAGDIIVSCAGTIGETYIMPSDCEQGIINQALMRIRLMPSVNVEYFLLYFDFILKDIARKSSKGSAIKNIPPFEKLKTYLLAFPPYGEQERIVKRLRSIVPYIQKIKKKEG